MEALPSLNALRAFDALARTGSVRGAAGALNVTSGAVSRQVTALNEQLGVELLEPDGRGVQLTEAGESLARSLRPAFAGIEEAVSRVRRSPVRETVHLTAPTRFAKDWLLPRLDGFGGGIDLMLGDESEWNGADLAIVWSRLPDDAGRAAEKLGDEEVFPVCAPEPGRRIAEVGGLAEVPLLHMTDIPSHWEWPTWPDFMVATGLDGAGAGRNVRLSRAMAMDAARSGQGLMLVNTTLARDDLAAGRLVRPLTASMALESGYWLLTPGSAVREEVAAVRDWLRAEHAACFGVRAGFVRRAAAVRP